MFDPLGTTCRPSLIVSRIVRTRGRASLPHQKEQQNMSIRIVRRFRFQALATSIALLLASCAYAIADGPTGAQAEGPGLYSICTTEAISSVASSLDAGVTVKKV